MYHDAGAAADDDWAATGDFIALPDGAITSSADLADFRVSRIGGPATPLSAAAPFPHPLCAACDRPLFLVAQLHAPVDAIDARVVYVLACNRRRCMLREGSFAVFRGLDTGAAGAGMDEEVYVSEDEEVQEPAAAPRQTVEFSLDQGDDAWGAAFGAEDDGGDAAAGGGWGDEPAGAAAAGDDDGWGTAAAADAHFQFAPTKPVKSAAAAAPPVEGKKKKQKRPKPAVAADAAPAATDETLASSLADLSLHPATAAPSFPAMYLSVEEEWVQSKHAKAAAYAHYQLGDGALDAELDAAAGSSHDAVPGWDVSAEGYEATRIKGYTKTLARFVDRVEDNPRQAVRYHFGGSPLAYSEHTVAHGMPRGAPSAAHGRVPPCPYCGAKRVYECQVMPTVLSLLNVEAQAPPPNQAELEAAGRHPSLWMQGMEFGTALVFVCGQNCRAEGLAVAGDGGVVYVPEVCLVQLEQE
ncbi:hypothetical protein H9P43_004188 [Blastocladiella emersonii ATCC 22665]|nr:hypothetical protein H9P43_004188 [Blastocladiella emersonii ATCC 22665]